MKIWAIAYDGPEPFSVEDDMDVFFFKDEAERVLKERGKNDPHHRYAMFTLDINAENPVKWVREELI